MTLTLPPEIEQDLDRLVRSGDYPDAEAVVSDALRALVRERERQGMEELAEQNGIDERRLAELLQEAEDSGDYTEMTSQDWMDIEQEGLTIVNTRKSA